MQQERWESRYTSGDVPWDSNIPSVELQRILSSQSIPAGRALELGCGTGINAVWLAHLEAATRPGSHYITLAGNSNDPASPETPGPPRVHAHELCAELHPLFDLVELREFRWSLVTHGDLVTQPLGWAALLRRAARSSTS